METSSSVGSLKLPSNCCPSVSQSFDYNQNIDVEVGISECVSGYAKPKAGVTPDAILFEFELEAMGDSFLQLNSIFVYTKFKVVREDGKDLKGDDHVAPINGIGNAMFRGITVTLNEKDFSTNSAQNVPYQSHLETLFSYNEEASKSHLKCAGWDMDTPGYYEDMALLGNNKGFVERAKWIRESKVVETCSTLSHDLFRANNFLSAGNRLDIKLIKSSNDFLLNTKAAAVNFRIQILDIRLYYNRCRLIPSVYNQVMQTKMQKYLMSKTQMVYFPLSPGITSYNANIFRGKILPKTILMCFCDSMAMEGVYAKNPFFFPHLDVSKLNLRMNGRSVPSTEMNPDFHKGLVIREYLRNFSNTGTWKFDRSHLITLDHFKKGSTIFAWDLTPDLCNSFHTHKGSVGVLDIEVFWSRPLPTAITMIILSSGDQVLTVDRDSRTWIDTEI